MKIEAPFFVPIISDDCDFFNEIKKELVEIIMDIHKNAPYQIQGNFPNNINLKYNFKKLKFIENYKLIPLLFF